MSTTSQQDMQEYGKDGEPMEDLPPVGTTGSAFQDSISYITSPRADDQRSRSPRNYAETVLTYSDNTVPDEDHAMDHDTQARRTQNSPMIKLCESA